MKVANRTLGEDILEIIQQGYEDTLLSYLSDTKDFADKYENNLKNIQEVLWKIVNT